MSFNLEDSSNQILTAGEFLAEEDQNFKDSIIYLVTSFEGNCDQFNDNNDDNNDDGDLGKSI